MCQAQHSFASLAQAADDFRTAVPVFASEQLARGLLRRLLRDNKRELLRCTLQEDPATHSAAERAANASLYRALVQHLAAEGRHFRIRRLSDASGMLAVLPVGAFFPKSSLMAASECHACDWHARAVQLATLYRRGLCMQQADCSCSVCRQRRLTAACGSSWRVVAAAGGGAAPRAAGSS